MTQSHRSIGGLINRDQEITFKFDGKSYQGFEGDTLASALMANGVRLLGRSFKYHRPRGLISAGSEEPNALVELGEGARQEPNTRATGIELFEGLSANSQNRFPSLAFDFMGINDLFSDFLSAGFYYKTFMWPRKLWESFYEPIIRKAAGLGSISFQDDPDSYDKGFLHCDVLVVGAGPSGLFSALIAGRSGARVVIADEDYLAGGRANFENESIGGDSASDWAANTWAELEAMPNVRCLRRTTVFGTYDHGIYGALERVGEHLIKPADNQPKQILWRLYAKKTILATGATERPIPFVNNDRPGIMMAGSMRAFSNRWASVAGRKVVLFTNNDDAYRTARDLTAKGVEIVAIIDTREAPTVASDFEVYSGAKIVNSKGYLGVSSVEIETKTGESIKLECDAVAVSGGWNPNVHLTSHHRERPIWREDISAFVPSEGLPVGQHIVGAIAGNYSTKDCFDDAIRETKSALSDLGIKSSKTSAPDCDDQAGSVSEYWYVPHKKGRAWVDYQNDISVKDIKLAHQENFRSVEHLKRYTTIGMATDQGKTGNVISLAVMAELEGKSIPETGTTIYRPPYTPVSIGAFAGRARDENFRPTRKTPSHYWAEEQGAVFVETGMWLRAQWFPRPGETHWRESVDREVNGTRNSVGVCDVTTLGKIDVQGKDAAEFLNKIYCNPFLKLKVGLTRYGLMLREDGMAMDDGTAARLGENHFVVTTTTANAVPVYRHMEFVRQCLHPELDVQLISTTEAWAQFAVAGPNSRKTLQKIVDPEFDISNEAFPFMACGEITVCGGLKARLFRISFSGELAYEIAVPTRYGDALMREIIKAGEEFDITPYGTEALGVMRIEKGHAAGNELNGTTTAFNLGMGRMVNKKKDSIGSILSEREALNQEDGLKLVGFMPVDAEQSINAGMHLIAPTDEINAVNDQGYLTSAAFSPSLASSIAIGFLKSGDTRLGETLNAVSPIQNKNVLVKVVSAHFVDPEGERLRA